MSGEPQRPPHALERREADQKKSDGAVITSGGSNTQGEKADHAMLSMLSNTATVDHQLPPLSTIAAPVGQQAVRTDDEAVEDAHPGAGGLKARLRAFLFGGEVARTIGRYTIERPLASGGMGSVFLATDEDLGRRVALKLVRYDRVSIETQARLRREAMALAKLAHPNIVSIYEVGEHEGLLFMAMEYVEGESLRAWLDAQPRSREACLEVFEQAASGLSAAHHAGLVHRDFKPANVLVGADGRVRIVDFGLVTTDEDADEPFALADAAAAPTQIALTQTGQLVGTPAYMAPEQFRGDRPTAASDQFAFFVALYEALTGERPFPGASVDELMRSVLDGDSRSMRLPSLPPKLRASITRGLAPEPHERYPSMDVVLEVLRTSRSARPRRWALPLALAGGALVFGALTFGSAPEAAPQIGATSTAAAAVAVPSEDELLSDDALARAALAPLLVARDDDERLRLANEYLAELAERGGVGRRLIAEAARGEVLWRRSCPDTVEGLCITVSPPDALDEPEGCETVPRVSRVERAPELAKPALAHLALATKLAAAQPTLDDELEARALSEAIGAAMALSADAELEAYLELRAPRGLDFSDDDDHNALSQDAFAAFMLQKTEAAQQLGERYTAVKQAGSPRWTVWASARTGVAYADFAHALVSIPMPAEFTTAAQREAYCAALSQQTAAPREQAEQAFAYCAEQAEAAGIQASCSGVF